MRNKENVARERFEYHYKPICNRTWSSVKKYFKENSLEMNRQNIISFGKMKKMFYGSGTGFFRYAEEQYQQLLAKYPDVEKLSLKGEEIFNTLQKETQAHRTTIVRWFQKVTQRGYGKEALYSPVEAYYLHLLAYQFKNRETKGEPKNGTH